MSTQTMQPIAQQAAFATIASRLAFNPGPSIWASAHRIEYHVENGRLLRFDIKDTPCNWTVNGELFDEHGFVVCPWCSEHAGSRFDCGEMSSLIDVSGYLVQRAFVDSQIACRERNAELSVAEIIRRSPVNAGPVTL